jgi:glutaminyl-peptide cyclotransferase
MKQLLIRRLSVTSAIVIPLAVLLGACGTPNQSLQQVVSETATSTPDAIAALPSPTLQPTEVVTETVALSPTPGKTVTDASAQATVATLLPPRDPLSPPALAFDGVRAMQHVEAQMQWAPRHTGTPGWQQTGDYIIRQIEAAGWQVEEQRFPYKDVEVRNIIAKRGSGPLLILGAHYDTRKYADSDPDPARRRDPVPGANDGASGVAVLLELAGHIDTEQLGREVWLAFFDAEDNGRIEGWEWIVGSRYMAEHLPRQPEAMILVDMIGDAELEIFYEQNSNRELSESIWSTAAELGYDQFIPEPKHWMLDDHTPFLERGVPAVDIIDFDYPYWHTVEDTTDKVSAESLEAVGRTLEGWLETRAQP